MIEDCTNPISGTEMCKHAGQILERIHDFVRSTHHELGERLIWILVPNVVSKTTYGILFILWSMNYWRFRVAIDVLDVPRHAVQSIPSIE